MCIYMHVCNYLNVREYVCMCMSVCNIFCVLVLPKSDENWLILSWTGLCSQYILGKFRII